MHRMHYTHAVYYNIHYTEYTVSTIHYALYYIYTYIVGYKAKGHKCSYALFEIFRSEDTANQGLPSYKV